MRWVVDLYNNICNNNMVLNQNNIYTRRKKLQDLEFGYVFPNLTKSTHPVEHICPALEGDTLEDCEHSLSEVVEAGDAPLRALPVRPGFTFANQ